jgi:hypothetical protein
MCTWPSIHIYGTVCRYSHGYVSTFMEMCTHFICTWPFIHIHEALYPCAPGTYSHVHGITPSTISPCNSLFPHPFFVVRLQCPPIWPSIPYEYTLWWIWLSFVSPTPSISQYSSTAELGTTSAAHWKVLILLMLWRPSNFTPLHSLTGPVRQLFASRLGG